MEPKKKAIILDGSSYNSITANIISSNNQQANNSYADIWLLQNSTYNSVCNNIITSEGDSRSAWGILEGSLADDYNIYSGNTVSGQASGSIGIVGIHSLRSINNPQT